MKKMGFAFLIKKNRAVHEWRIYKQVIVKFCKSKFENHISTRSFSFLLTDSFITTIKTYACKWKTEVKHFL